MVTLSSYPTLPDASIIVGMLESNGIHAIIQNDNNLYVPIFGGVKILVDESDYDKALALLTEHNDN